ncbi:hypothetical protein NKH47_25915 [Mesorhizobium sp. M1060]|uniref:hypothetical protein n=1 Tax=Mesorhizobium sp. M1060 TaxID=2957052 RepID=UPI003338252F
MLGHRNASFKRRGHRHYRLAEARQWARGVVAAESDAVARGLSAFAMDGKMIDPPVVRRAHEILALAGSN